MLKPPPAARDPLIAELPAGPSTEPLIAAPRVLEPLAARHARWREALDSRLVDALRGRGVDALYSHQARAVKAVREGRNVCVVTPTASGKTLCYNLPVLDAIVRDPTARAL